MYEIIIYLRWCNDFSRKEKIYYIKHLSKGYMERCSYIDFKYCDIFTIYFDYVYNDGKRDINTIKAALNSCRKRDRLKYHYFLYEGLIRYFNCDSDHRDYLSLSGKLFSAYAKDKAYGNHNLRGLQYIVSDDDIRYYSRRSFKKLNIDFIIKSNRNINTLHVIALDSKYYTRFSKYFLLQQKKNSIRVHIHIINPTLEQLNELSSNEVNHSIEYEGFSDKKPYYISSRFLIMNKVMEEYRNVENFLITDADCIINEESVFDLISDFGKSSMHSFAMQSNQSFYPWSKHGAGMVLVKNNNVSLRFFKLFNKCFFALYDIDRSNVMNTQWWIDQGIIYSLIEYYDIELFTIEDIGSYIFFPKGDKDLELKEFLEKKGKK